MTVENPVKNPKISIQKCTYSNLNLNQLLEPLGGMKHFVKSGERVLLKVNLLSASTPESAVVTHPEVVKEVAKAVQSVGGIPFIADSPGGKFSKRRLENVYERSGMNALANELGIELNYDTGSKKVTVNKGQAKKLKKVPICNFVSKADKIIALPKVKTHSLMYMTLATKIMYGAIPGLTKARYHSRYIRRKSFADMLLDTLAVTSPQLFIMDGVLAMQGDGPFSGQPFDLGLILAAEDAVALDLAVCRILGIEPVGIPCLKQAKLRGLWPDKIQYPLKNPEDVKHTGFVLPSSASYLLTGKKRPKRSPIPNEKCTACGECKEICPRKAIKIINNKAQVDYSLCIKCYCCHEICPENAINLGVVK